MEMTFQLLEQLSHKPRLLVGLGIVNVAFQLFLSAVCATLLITISPLLIIRKIFCSEKRKQSYQQKTFN